MDKWKEDTERLMKRSYRAPSGDSDHRETLRQRALAAYDRSRSVPRQFTSVLHYLESTWRWVMSRPIPRLGVPVGVAVLALIGVISLFPARSGWAVEDFVKPLLTAKTGRCKIVVNTKDQPALTLNTMFRGSVFRQESPDIGTISIFDEATGDMLSLSPQQKKAMILQATNRDPEKSSGGGFLQRMREQITDLQDDKQVKRVSLGERDFMKHHLIGFRITSSAMKMDLWGDSKTGLPHTIVAKLAGFPNVEMTMTDFEFNIDLEESLFSLIPPAGYTVTKGMFDHSKPKEEDFIAALKQFTDLNDGDFPDAVNMDVAISIMGKIQANAKTGTDQSQEIARVVGFLARGFTFPLNLPVESNAAYAGKGVTRDDAKKPIFWYETTENKRVIRVIHADLSVDETDQPPEADHVQRFEPVQ